MKLRVRVTHFTVDLHEIERMLLHAEEQRNFLRVKAHVMDARRMLLDVLDYLRSRAT